MHKHPIEPSPNDQALLKQAAAGDPAAFETFYRRHRDWAIRIAQRYTTDLDQALDVTQAVFCRILDRIDRITITTSARAYLATSLRNEAINRAKRQSKLRLTADPQPEAAPEQAPSDTLTRALASLPDQQREIIILWAEHDLTHTQIAEVLNIPIGTVKTRSRAALKTLRQTLSDDFPDL